MSPVRVKSFFTLKDKLPKILLSGLNYKCKCGICNATCYGKTKRQLKVPVLEHLGILPLTGKKVKIENNKVTAIQEYLLYCNYSSSYDNFSIFTRWNNNFRLKIMESILIAQDKPVLNKADSSLSLELICYFLVGLD